jgi:hypothetical protein
MRTDTMQRGAPVADGQPERGRGSRTLGRIRAFWRRPASPDVRPDAYEVLNGARAVIEQGWVQNRWFVRRNPELSLREQIFSNKVSRLDDVTAACLVGAVVRSVRQYGSTNDLVTAGPALDLLWDAWQESRGFTGPGVSGRAAPREARMARARDLMRWNDQPGRTQADVLRLLDVATTRAIMAEVGGGDRGGVRA